MRNRELAKNTAQLFSLLQTCCSARGEVLVFSGRGALISAFTLPAHPAFLAFAEREIAANSYGGILKRALERAIKRVDGARSRGFDARSLSR